MSRLQPAEFSDLVSDHVEAIRATQETLQTVNDLFCSGQWVLPTKFENIVECLMSIGEHCRRFHAFIGQSGHLPLVVVPLRLSLLMTLKDVDMQVTKLLRLLATLYELIWITLYQPVEEKLEALQALNELQLDCKEVLKQVDILNKNLRSEMDKWVCQEFCV
jgi:hypothetical protein